MTRRRTMALTYSQMGPGAAPSAVLPKPRTVITAHSLHVVHHAI